MDVRRARCDAGVSCTAVACGRCAEACTRLDAILAVCLFLAAAILPLLWPSTVACLQTIAFGSQGAFGADSAVTARGFSRNQVGCHAVWLLTNQVRHRADPALD